MLNGVSIPYELADRITEMNLRDMRKSTLECIQESANNAHKPHEQENLRNYYQTLFALEEVLRYMCGEKWDDK